MASDGTPPASAPSGSNEAPAAPSSPPKYVPQFSAMTEMILKRVQAGTGGTFTNLASTGQTEVPAGYADMRRTVMESMKTTANMEIPTTPAATASRAKGRASASRSSATPTTTSASGAKVKGAPRSKGKAKGGPKRKRARSEEEEEETEESDSAMSKLGGDSDSDGEGSIPDLPKMTQSGRQIVKPQQFVPSSYEPATKRRAPSRKSQELALCKRCGRGHSPDNNMIVFCDGCNGGWHQQCHDPKVSDEAVQDETAPWFCGDCSRKKGIEPVPEPPKSVSWAGRSSEEKRAYLVSLPHHHLVSLLLQATTYQPNLPIFPVIPTPAPTPAITIPVQPSSRPAYKPNTATTTTFRNTTVYPQQPFPPSSASAAGLFSRSEANPNAPINFIRKIPTSSSHSPVPTTPLSATPPQPPAQMFTHAASAPPQLSQAATQPDEDLSRESTPASPPYPKAGNGLMAKLGPDEDDIEWLADQHDFEAFSHTVYDHAGERIEENGVAINGSSAVH